MWNCGEGIFAVSDAIVRNNIIANSCQGFSSYPHNAVAGKKNLTIVNNTIYGGSECLLIRWDTVNNGVLANNASYCPGKTAVDATGLSRAGITVRANYVKVVLNGMTIDNVAFFSGGAATAAFTDPNQFNFWPHRDLDLLGKADTNLSPQDFNVHYGPPFRCWGI